jgi:hypothetical protein
MPYHRFKIDQTVVPSTPTVPSGRYTILQLVPIADAGPRYRIRRIEDGIERLVLEGQIRLPEANMDDSRSGSPMPNCSQTLNRLIQGVEAAAAAATKPDTLDTLITTLNVVIASNADPYLVSAALIEGLAATVARKMPDAKQGEVSVEVVVRLLRDRLRLHGAI